MNVDGIKRFLPLRKLVEVVLHLFDIVSNDVDLDPEHTNHWKHGDQTGNLFHRKQVINFHRDTLEESPLSIYKHPIIEILQLLEWEASVNSGPLPVVRSSVQRCRAKL